MSSPEVARDLGAVQGSAGASQVLVAGRAQEAMHRVAKLVEECLELPGGDNNNTSSLK